MPRQTAAWRFSTSGAVMMPRGLAELALEEGRPADAERDARQLTSEAHPEFDRTRLVALHILTARARLALADPGAAAALDLARPLVAKSERIDPRHALAIAEAQLEAAQGDRDRARTQLSALCCSLAASKMVLRSRECARGSMQFSERRA